MAYQTWRLNAVLAQSDDFLLFAMRRAAGPKRHEAFYVVGRTLSRTKHEFPRATKCNSPCLSWVLQKRENGSRSLAQKHPRSRF